MFKLKWLTPNLAGGFHPLRNNEFNLIENDDWYSRNGINHVISVFETPISNDILKCVPWGNNYTFFPTNDGMPPHNLLKLCNIIKQSNGTFVHCFAGLGRTATVLAAYLLFDKQEDTAMNAVQSLRRLYDKGALHTPEQYIELVHFNNENKTDDELKHDINMLFDKAHYMYNNRKKYKNLWLLSNKEKQLILDKFGKNSPEYLNTLKNHNKIERMLKFIYS